MSKTGGSNRSGIGMASTCVCEKTKFIREIALCPSGSGSGGGGGRITILPPVLSVSWLLIAGMSWLLTSEKRKAEYGMSWLLTSEKRKAEYIYYGRL